MSDLTLRMIRDSRSEQIVDWQEMYLVAQERIEELENQNKHVLEMEVIALESLKIIEKLEARIAELELALTQSVTAIDDWLNTYAAELCDESRVEEARDRIRQYGTIGYIAKVQKGNRKALEQGE